MGYFVLDIALKDSRDTKKVSIPFLFWRMLLELGRKQELENAKNPRQMY